MSSDWGFIGGIIGGVIGGITTIVIVMIWIIVTCRKSRSGDQRHSPGSTGIVLSDRCFIAKNICLKRLGGQAKASLRPLRKGRVLVKRATTD